MGFLSVRARVVAASSYLLVLAVFYACTPTDDENPATGGSRTVDSGQASPGIVTQDGSSPSTDGTLCDKYGGDFAAKALGTTILTYAQSNCRIGPFITDALGDEGQTAHVTECFSFFVAGAFQCPSAYVQGTSKDSANRECESVLPGVTFSAQDWLAFGDFNADPASAAKAILAGKGLSADDLRTVATAFEGAKTNLINGDVPADKFTKCAPSCSIGGQACIPYVDGGRDGGGIADAGADAKDATSE